jgi:hypothetical protein
MCWDTGAVERATAASEISKNIMNFGKFVRELQWAMQTQYLLAILADRQVRD